LCLCEWCWFFFSSRRRHTRFKCDWSSDVCSSDLPQSQIGAPAKRIEVRGIAGEDAGADRAQMHREIARNNGARIIADPSLGLEEIGRASCREREEIPGVAVSVKERSERCTAYMQN